MGDARGWNTAEFKACVQGERSVKARIVFSLQFVPAPTAQHIIVGSSDGSVCVHSLSKSPPIVNGAESPEDLAKPLVSLPGHEGPTYGLLFFGEPSNEMLASCGDDGRVAVWRWKDIGNAIQSCESFVCEKQRALDLQIPQQRGDHGALQAVSEVNGVAFDMKAGQLYGAAGDGCAYAWDMVTGQRTMVFRGHSDYLQCIASRSSQKQIITGSEDGTVRIWDCRSGRCTAMLDPWNAVRVSSSPSTKVPWVSSLSIESSDNWLACGSGSGCLTLWNLPMLVSAMRITASAEPKAVTFTKDEIVVAGTQPHISRFNFGGKVVSQTACAPLSSYCVDVHPSGVTAVGGYAGMVDVISSFGSHLCTFCC